MGHFYPTSVSFVHSRTLPCRTPQLWLNIMYFSPLVSGHQSFCQLCSAFYPHMLANSILVVITNKSSALHTRQKQYVLIILLQLTVAMAVLTEKHLQFLKYLGKVWIQALQSVAIWDDYALARFLWKRSCKSAGPMFPSCDSPWNGVSHWLPGESFSWQEAQPRVLNWTLPEIWNWHFALYRNGQLRKMDSSSRCGFSL